MQELPPPLQTWMENAKRELEAAGVATHFPETDLLEYRPGVFCSGYFEDDDPTKPKFGVAVGRHWEKWFPIAVHEFCHFQQWRENREWWDSLKFEGKEGLDLAIEAWEGKIEATPTQIIMWCMSSAEAEYDCERRALQAIRDQGLPIDPVDYAKKANSYITYYYAMPELKGWCNGERPYEVPELMDLMPGHLLDRPVLYWDLACQAMDLYREHCLHAKPG